MAGMRILCPFRRVQGQAYDLLRHGNHIDDGRKQH